MPWSEGVRRDVWLPLAPCPGCGRTLPRGTDRCPSCGRPAMLSVRMADYSRWVGRRTADLVLLTLFLGAGAVAVYFSPILVLFPLMLLKDKSADSLSARRRSRKPKSQSPPPPPAP